MTKPCTTSTIHDQAAGPVPDPAPAVPAQPPADPAPADPPPRRRRPAPSDTAEQE